MKKIEDLFRSALKDQELPYDDSAWNEMSKRLDARGGSAGQLKWILGAAVVAAITIGSILYVNNKEPKTNKITAPKLASNEGDLKLNSNEGNNESLSKNIDANTVEDDQSSENTSENTQSSKSIGIDIDKKEFIIEEVRCCGDVEPVVEEILVPPVYREALLEKEVEEQLPTMNSENLVFASISNYCLNEEWSYFNKNNVSVWLNSPKNDLVEIGAGSKHQEVLSEKGIYHIGTLNDMEEFESRVIFTVFESTEAQMIADDALNYENGLPELIVEAYQEGQNTWTLDGEIQAKNQSTHSFNLFEKGIHVMSIKTTDVNGCHAKSSVTFHVEADYNLLAVNAFSPSSLEPRNTHFIPFALTQRNTPFKMIVIDPTDGAVLFETSAADIPWDGTDRNTGKMVDANKSYVWKVILEQPKANENPEYIGTVVRL
jgi:hypothetical protein